MLPAVDLKKMKVLLVLLVFVSVVYCVNSTGIHFTSPTKFNMGYVGIAQKSDPPLIATGWTYFDFDVRKQRVDYALLGSLVSWDFSWGNRVMLANYTGFSFENGLLKCESGLYPAPFPHPNSTLFDPPMIGVSIVEGFGPCYGWMINMGNYHMVYYSQVSSGWKPCMMVSNIYSVKYVEPSLNGINSTTFDNPSMCSQPHNSAKTPYIETNLEDLSDENLRDPVFVQRLIHRDLWYVLSRARGEAPDVFIF